MSWVVLPSVIIFATLGSDGLCPDDPMSGTRRNMTNVETASAGDGIDEVKKADQLDAQARKHVRDGKLREAIPLLQEVIRLREHALGPEHEKLGIALYNLGDIHRRLREYDKAIPRFERSLMILERAYPDNVQSAGITRYHIGEMYKEKGDDQAAIKWIKEAAISLEKALRPNDPNLGATYAVLGDLQQKRKQLENAAESYGRALEIYQRPPNIVPVSLFASMHDLATAFKERGDFAPALLLYRASLDAVAKMGPDSTHMADVSFDIGDLFEKQERHIEARSAFQRTLRIREKREPVTLQLAAVQVRLARLDESIGDFEAARQLDGQALEIVQRLRPGEVPTADLQIQLAFLNLKLGDAHAARPLIDRAMGIYQEKYGKDNPALLHPLSYLTGTLLILYDYVAAKPLLEMEVKLTRGKPNVTPRQLAMALEKLAIAERNLGHLKVAQELRKEALDILTKAGGEDDPETLMLAGRIAEEEGNRELAKAQYEKALAAFERAKGEGSVSTAVALAQLATLREEDPPGPGDEETKKLYEQAIGIRKKMYGPDHPNFGAILFNYSKFEWRRGDRRGAIRDVLEAARISGAHARRILPTLSFAEQSAFTTIQMKSHLIALFSVCEDGEVLERAYGEFFRWKGVLIESLRRESALAALGTDPAYRPDVERLQAVRASIAGWYQRAGAVPYDEWEKEHLALTAQKEGLERKLLQALPRLALTDVMESVADLDTFRQVLGGDEVFVDIYRHRTWAGDGDQYSAIILARGGPVRLVRLGDAKWLDAVIAAWRMDVLSRREAGPSWEAAATQTWGRLRKSLPEGIKKVWLSPDGELANLPWHLFPPTTPETRDALLAQVNSPRELVRFRTRERGAPTPASNVLLVGDIAYGGPAAGKVGEIPGSLAEIETLESLAKGRGLSVTRRRPDGSLSDDRSFGVRHRTWRGDRGPGGDRPAIVVHGGRSARDGHVLVEGSERFHPKADGVVLRPTLAAPAKSGRGAPGRPAESSGRPFRQVFRSDTLVRLGPCRPGLVERQN